jgi:hypothetical protein
MNRKTLGPLLILLGLGFFVHHLGVWTLSHWVWRYWPLTIAAVGLLQFFAGPKTRTSGTLIICVGVLLQLRQLAIFPANLGDFYWPLTLILMGAWVIAHRD